MNNDVPNAMAFYHPDGLVPAWKHARQYAGETGRLATLPDIIDARIASEPNDASWEKYFTTLSAEYVGFSRGGNPIAIVAHGVGPMATLDGALAAYSHQFNDKERNRRGGRISTRDFRKLENGGFGDVAVIDLAATWSRRVYHFSGHAITRWDIAAEPLWRARLGPKWEEYCTRHETLAKEWSRKEGHPNHAFPCILAMEGSSNCSYHDRTIFDHWMMQSPNTALAHLLSTRGLTSSRHEYWESTNYNIRENRISLVSEVACHDWTNSVRFVGVRGGSVLNVHPGFSDIRLTRHLHHDRLMVPTDGREAEHGFFALMRGLGGVTFTQYPKAGARMDTAEPQFLVTEIEAVEGGPECFRTTTPAYYGWLKYDVDEVQRITPQGANAYMISGDPVIEWSNGNPTHHVVPVTFYRVKIDPSQRMLRSQEIYNNFDLIMQLASTND